MFVEMERRCLQHDDDWDSGFVLFYLHIVGIITNQFYKAVGEKANEGKCIFLSYKITT